MVCLNSITSHEAALLDFKIDKISLCVVPANNRDDLEIQFADADEKTPTKKEESLVQITLHFPSEEDEEGATQAESFHRQIIDTGVLRSVMGDIITEFSKEQGNFVTPRGKYAIQVKPLNATINHLFYLDYFNR